MKEIAEKIKEQGVDTTLSLVSGESHGTAWYAAYGDLPFFDEHPHF